MENEIPNQKDLKTLIREQIAAIAAHTGKTQEDISEQLGYTRYYISDVLTPSSVPSKKFLRNLQNLYESILESNRLEEPAAADSYTKQRRDKKLEEGFFMVPVIPVKAQAGYTQSYGEQTFIDSLERFPILPGVEHLGSVWRYFVVGGDSMSPELDEGDLLLCSGENREDWNDLKKFYTYVIVTPNDVWVKRLYAGIDGWYLISANTAYPIQSINKEDIQEIWVIRRHVRRTIPSLNRYEVEGVTSDDFK